MPPEAEIDRLLDGVLATMNIPHAKISEFKADTKERKWRLIVSTRQAQYGFACGFCFAHC